MFSQRRSMSLILQRHTLRQTNLPHKLFFHLLVALWVGLFAVCSQAQSALPEQALKELQKLPRSAQNAVKQLAALNELPSPQWKMHPADVAHGEAVNLNDSA